jgi:UDP-glucuronate 4-epimerase
VKGILKAAGKEDLVPEYLPPQQGDVDHTWGDNEHARELLGWTPKVPIEEGIKRFVEWYKDKKELHDQIKY